VADSERVADVTGRAVKVGDRIAAAFREGNVAELRVGHVTGFGERNYYGVPRRVVAVDWEDGSGYGRPQSSSIFADLQRFVVIAEED